MKLDRSHRQVGLGVFLTLVLASVGCGSVTAVRADAKEDSKPDGSVGNDTPADIAQDTAQDVVQEGTAEQPVDRPSETKPDVAADLAVEASVDRPADMSVDRPPDAPTESRPDGADAGPDPACMTPASCTFYPTLGPGCCGACRAKGEPAPPQINCLIACRDPHTGCACMNGICTPIGGGGMAATSSTP
jgi:hypothetical protein